MASTASGGSTNSATRMTSNMLRFSDVAQFVGLSLLSKDKSKLDKSKVKVKVKSTLSEGYQSASFIPVALPSSKQGSKPQYPSMQRPASLPAFSSADSNEPTMSRQLSSADSTDPMHRLRSSLLACTDPNRPQQLKEAGVPAAQRGSIGSPSLPATMLDQSQRPSAKEPPFPTRTEEEIREQNRVAAQRLAHKNKLVVMDQKVANCTLSKAKVHKQVEKTQERVQYHRNRLRYVDSAIAKLEEELRAGEEAALERERIELQREREQRARLQHQAALEKAAAESQKRMQTSTQPSRIVDAKVPKLKQETQEAGTEAEQEQVAAAAAAAQMDGEKEEMEYPEAVEAAVVDKAEARPRKSLSSLPPLNASVEQSHGSPAARMSLKEDLVFDGGGSPTNSPVGDEPDRSPSKFSKALSETSSKPPGILKSPSAEMARPDPSAFESEKELLHYRQEIVRRELAKCAGSPLAAFKSINLNGSGNISSQEFADGVKRLGVPWQQITGFTHPRQLFKIFDLEKTGVITFYELFPAERHKTVDDSGMTTPDFWKKWVSQNRHMDQGCGGPKWASGSPEDELALIFSAQEKKQQAEFKHEWMKKTFRKYKSRGKSDARCREMVALHLPGGSGPLDLQGVKLFSENDVKHCKRVYNDAVNEPQRRITKAVEDLKEQRHQIHKVRTDLWVVAMEPHAKEEQLMKAKQAFSSLHLGLHKEDGPEEAAAPPPKSSEPEHEEQASFGKLAENTGMGVLLIEDVFRVWMRHSDKTETIGRKQFQRLLEDLCPSRTIVENDLSAWWDAVHGKSYAECLTVDWTAADDRYQAWRKASLGAEGRRSLATARKSPATFDQFITWWATSEVRQQ